MPSKNRNASVLALIVAASIVSALPSTARSEIMITVQQVGNNVVMTGSGSANIAALSGKGTSSFAASVDTGEGDGLLLGSTSSSTSFEFEGNISGPSGGFDNGGYSEATASSGSGSEMGTNTGQLFLPTGYVSGTALSATDTYDNTTIAGLDLKVGTYTYTWGSGANADSLVLTIGTAAVPEPASIVMTGGMLGLGGLVMARRKRRRLAQG